MRLIDESIMISLLSSRFDGADYELCLNDLTGVLLYVQQNEQAQIPSAEQK